MRPTGLIFCTNPTTIAAAPDSRLRENDEMQISPLRATLKMTLLRSIVEKDE